MGLGRLSIKMGVIGKIVLNPEKAITHCYDLSRIPYLIALLKSRRKPSAVFIWIPKTAGTSIWLALDAPKLKSLDLIKYRFANRGIVTFGHMDYSQLISKGLVTSSFDDSAFKLAFVRNPYDRAVSLYSYLKKKTKKIPADETFLNFCRRIETTGCSPIGLYNTHNLSQCNPQVRWVENISMDYIGKVESIEKDFEAISSKLGLNKCHIPHANKSDRLSYQDYYCRESKEIIQNFYKEDFLAFGYSKQLSIRS
jgi:hypothetical protein